MQTTVVDIALQTGKKLYFASDFHLGAPNHAESLLRERKIVAWLESTSRDAQAIFLVGDLFDFWFEYRRAVPRGFVRLLGKLAELTDAGVEIFVFPGNHDMWMNGYFEEELNIKTYRQPVNFRVSHEGSAQVQQFYITHGDGLGPGDYFYKTLKTAFESRWARWAFANLLPADVALGLAHAWARNSWQKHEKQDKPVFLGPEKEWLLLYAQEIEAQQHHDFYIFGHRHIELDYALNPNSRMLILGDWITLWTFAEFENEEFGNLKIREFENLKMGEFGNLKIRK